MGVDNIRRFSIEDVSSVLQLCLLFFVVKGI